MMESLKLISAFDRDTGSKLLVNGEEIARVNYDEHGSSGEELLRQVMSGLAEVFNIVPEIDEVPDEDF